MKEEIQKELEAIEAKEGVRILFCAEAGSRARGLDSPDSDYDVRFVYVRKPEEYLRLEETRDVIKWKRDPALDINGWDLQKALRLLYKSNPALFEWVGSPIVYKTTPEWEGVSEVMGQYFVPKQAGYHYHQMARRNYAEMQGKEGSPKKYLTVLRALLSCRWVQKYGTPPPVLFKKFLEILPKEIYKPVAEMVEMKKKTMETRPVEQAEEINQYIESELSRFARELEYMQSRRNADWETLNKVFLQAIKA